MSDETFTAILQELFDIAVDGGDAVRSGHIASPFKVRHGAYVIRVDFSAGSSKDLSLTTKYDTVARADHPALVARGYRGGASPLVARRPLGIKLEREDGDHVAAKAKGLNVEWQSGDAAFDRAVYVDTPTTDPAILAAVIGPEVRRAVRELFALGFNKVWIDGEPGVVSADLSEFSSREPPKERGVQALRAFSQILANLPVIASSGRLVQRSPLEAMTVVLALIGTAGWAGSIFYVKGVLAIMTDWFGVSESAANLAWWEIAGAIGSGIVVGIVGSLVYGRIMAALARGTSSAHKSVLWAQIAGFFGTSVVAFTAALVAIVLSHAK